MNIISIGVEYVLLAYTIHNLTIYAVSMGPCASVMGLRVTGRAAPD